MEEEGREREREQLPWRFGRRRAWSTIDFPRFFSTREVPGHARSRPSAACEHAASRRASAGVRAFRFPLPRRGVQCHRRHRHRRADDGRNRTCILHGHFFTGCVPSCQAHARARAERRPFVCVVRARACGSVRGRRPRSVAECMRIKSDAFARPLACGRSGGASDGCTRIMRGASASVRAIARSYLIAYS